MQQFLLHANCNISATADFNFSSFFSNWKKKLCLCYFLFLSLSFSIFPNNKMVSNLFCLFSFLTLLIIYRFIFLFCRAQFHCCVLSFGSFFGTFPHINKHLNKSQTKRSVILTKTKSTVYTRFLRKLFTFSRNSIGS